MIKIAICDDEMTFVDKINTLISEWSAQNHSASLSESDYNAFFLIDRGCIVNLTQIISVKNNECILNGDIHLPVSQARMRPLKECLLTFWQSNL